LNQNGSHPDLDPRTLGRRRRAKRAFAANYIHELSERHNGKAQARPRVPERRVPRDGLQS
jgi:hypothetical protein